MCVVRFLVYFFVCLAQSDAAQHPKWFVPESGCRSAVCCKSGAACTVRNRSEPSIGCLPAEAAEGRIFRIKCSGARECFRIDVNKIREDINFLTIENCEVIIAPETFSTKQDIHFLNKGFLTDTWLFSLQSELSPVEWTWPKWPGLQKIVLNGAKLSQVPMPLLTAAVKSLKHLELANNQLSVINNVEFIALTQLSGVEYINLDDNNIVDFGQEFVKTFMKLIKLNNKLKIKNLLRKLGVHSAHVTHVLTQSICRGLGICLDAVDPYVGSVIGQNLYITASNLKISVQFVYDKQSLRVLRLNRNKLTRIPDSLFAFNYLEELHLADNKISKEAFTRSKGSVFKIMTRLRVLSLEGNSIEALGVDALQYLTALERFHVGRNRLHFLPSGIFRTLQRLDHLDVSNNLLVEFKVDPSLRALRRLNISRNRLISINHEMVLPFPALERLDASGNPLQAIAFHAFKSLHALRWLDLRDNKLVTLSASSFKMMSRAGPGERVRLWLFGQQQPVAPSRLTCDCDSLFLAGTRENDNIRLLAKSAQGFLFPVIEPPQNTSWLVCSNTEGHLLSFSEAVQVDGAGDHCAITDTDCPQTCPCCSRLASCGCAFKCPRDCSCFRSQSWRNVTVHCEHTPMQTLPATFATQPASPIEQALVTKMTILDANLLLLESPERLPCPKGLQDVMTLSIQESNVHQVHAGAFRCFRSMRSLSLTHNPLKALPAALFSVSNKHLTSVNVSNNRLLTIAASTFSSLPNLALLDLSRNPFLCDCSWEVSFWSWAAKSRRQGLSLILPDSCRASSLLRRFGFAKGKPRELRFSAESLKAACDLMRANRSGFQRHRELVLFATCPTIAVLLIGMVLFFVYYRHRYALWIKIDTAVRWHLGRRLLRLPLAQDKSIDVALIFHESQMNEQSEITNFIHATGRSLTVESIAYYMPGARVVDQLSTLMHEAAVCFLYITNDFLNDINYMGPIHEFLGDCYHLETIRLVPIYPGDGSSKDHERMAQLQPILRRYNGLAWGCQHFWERIHLALPPPRTSQLDNDATGLWLAERNRKVADVCVMSHETQLHLVRALFERYDRALSVVHYRHGAVYNCAEVAVEERPQSLLQLCLWCRQIILVLSPSLLQDAVELENVTRDLRYRLTCLQFRGSLILLNADVGPLAFNAAGRGGWAELLQTFGPAVVQLKAEALAREDWAALDAALCGMTRHAAPGQAMDDARYARTLREGGLEIDTGAQDVAEFEVNRVRWMMPHEQQDRDDVPLLIDA